MIHPLRELRQEKELSQADLALLLEVDTVVISQIEGGHRAITNFIPDLEKYLGIDAEDFRRRLDQYKAARKEEIIHRLKTESV